MMFAASIIALVFSVAPAAAADRLHGLVLATTPATGEIIVRHDPVGGMPAMTMPFRVVPRGAAAKLPVGARIDAAIDRSTDPWTLRGLRVTEPAPPVAPPLRDAARHPLRLGDTLPEIAGAVDQRGRPFRFSALRGETVVLAFVYTRCQDARMCPLISAKFRQLQERLRGRAVHLVEVTLDPTYDRPAVLARYGSTFGADPARWSLVVGQPDATMDFSSRFGIGAFSPQSGLVIHAENTVLVDPSGRITDEITETSWTPDEIIAQLDARVGRGGNPLSRFALWLAKNAAAACGNGTGQFSALLDLGVVLIILIAATWALVRIAKGIFADPN